MNTDDGTTADVVVDNDTGLPVEAPEVTETPATEPAAETTEEAGAEQPKPKRSPQERIDKAVRAQREAEREAQYWRDQAMRGAPETKPEPAATEGRPDPTSFAAGEYDPAYIEQLTDWKAEQAVSKALSSRKTQDADETRARTFQERVRAASEKLDDFDEVVFGGAKEGTWVCTTDMLAAIQETEKGPEVAYHLASNPAEAQRIAGLSSRAQAIEIGKLEARLSEPVAPKPKTVSDAPAPIGQVRGAAGTFKVGPDTSDFAAFEKAY